MQIKDYLDEILNSIAEHPFIVSQSLSNALDPLAKNLSTYPEHKHTTKGLISAKRPAFKEVLSGISGLIKVEK